MACLSYGASDVRGDNKILFVRRLLAEGVSRNFGHSAPSDRPRLATFLPFARFAIFNVG